MSKKIFMGGICGMGMCPLAIFLRQDGNEVSGFDDTPNPDIAELLTRGGVTVSNIRLPASPPDEFIISSALVSNAKELQTFGAKKFMRRGEALAKICENRKLVAVCGSHGKTTSTALLAHAINEKSLNAGYMVGAIPSEFSPVKHCAKQEFFAAEIDESDATIEHFSPHITLALNGDLDHTDTYPDEAALSQMFARLFARTTHAVIIPKGDALLKNAAANISAKLMEISVPQNDFLEYDKRMALAALNEMFTENFTPDIFGGFAGVARRQEILADTEKLLAIADYAHHPSEVSAFLNWFENLNTDKKLIFFQPHRYTRTKRFAEDFKKIFEERVKLGDEIRILPVYPASEPYDPEGTADKITNTQIVLTESGELKKIIADKMQNSAARISVAFIGAGNIYFEAKKALSL